MRTIILYGELEKRFGREHKFAVRTPSEAIQALCANFKGFRNYLSRAHLSNTGFNISVGDIYLRKDADIVTPSSFKEVIKIVPVIIGSSGELKTFLGVTLIMVGAVLNATGVGGALGTVMINVGIGLTLNGVAEMLSPQPGRPGGAGGIGDNGESYIFSGPQNVTRQGGIVPVGYGRMMVGSTIISASIEDSDQ